MAYNQFTPEIIDMKIAWFTISCPFRFPLAAFIQPIKWRNKKNTNTNRECNLSYRHGKNIVCIDLESIKGERQ